MTYRQTEESCSSLSPVGYNSASDFYRLHFLRIDTSGGGVTFGALFY